MHLSVVIPAYNEEKRIEKTLFVVHKYLSQQSFAWEILIVLDGCTDKTLACVESFAAGKKGYRWIDRKENRGKGYTMRQGMLAATGAVRLITDADNSTDISHFDKMKPLFTEGYDVVIGSRDSKDAAGAIQAVPQSFLKRLLGNLGNLFVQLVAVPGIWDTQCGFKAFTAEAAEYIFPLAKIDRWAIDMETLALARRGGFRIGIVPAHWVNDAGTHVRKLDYFATLFETLKIRYYLMTGAYQNRESEQLSVSSEQ